MGWGADKKPAGPTEVYFEFTQIGAQMRVAAIDAATGTEVIIIAPVSATQFRCRTLRSPS